MLSNIISFVASKFADKAINAGIDAVLEDDSGGGGNIVSPPNFDAARIYMSQKTLDNIKTGVNRRLNARQKQKARAER